MPSQDGEDVLVEFDYSFSRKCLFYQQTTNCMLTYQKKYASIKIIKCSASTGKLETLCEDKIEIS